MAKTGDNPYNPAMFSTRNIPNLITLSRIVAVIAIFYLVPFQSNMAIIWGALLYATAGFTDYLDGWIARRYALISDLGKVLDPLADKILVLVFLPLLQMQVIHFFPVFIIFAREFAIMALRVVAAKRGHSISANFSGKLKTAITLPVCGILFGRIAVPHIKAVPTVLMPIEWLRLWIASWPLWVIQGLVWLTVIVTIGSFIDYLWRFFWQRTLEKSQGDVKTAKRKLLIVLPNTLTLLNFICGLIAAYAGLQNNLRIAAGLILMGMYLDAFDGRLARKLNVNSRFGASMDSGADYVTFGIAPAIMLYMGLSHTINGFTLGPISVGALVVALAHYAAVHFRLRRFNKSGHKDSFEGLPSPTGAVTIAIAVTSVYLSSPTLLIPISLLISGLMVSTLEYPHNAKAMQHPLLRRLKLPSIIFFLLAMAAFLGARDWIRWNVGELFLLFVVVYLLYPLYAKHHTHPHG